MSRFYEYQKRIVSVFLICLMCICVREETGCHGEDQGSGLHGDRGR